MKNIGVPYVKAHPKALISGFWTSTSKVRAVCLSTSKTTSPDISTKTWPQWALLPKLWQQKFWVASCIQERIWSTRHYCKNFDTLSNYYLQRDRTYTASNDFLESKHDCKLHLTTSRVQLSVHLFRDIDSTSDFSCPKKYAVRINELTSQLPCSSDTTICLGVPSAPVEIVRRWSVPSSIPSGPLPERV